MPRKRQSEDHDVLELFGGQSSTRDRVGLAIRDEIERAVRHDAPRGLMERWVAAFEDFALLERPAASRAPPARNAPGAHDVHDPDDPSLVEDEAIEARGEKARGLVERLDLARRPGHVRSEERRVGKEGRYR